MESDDVNTTTGPEPASAPRASRQIGLWMVVLAAVLGGIVGAATILLVARQPGYRVAPLRAPYVEAGARAPERSVFTEAIRRAEPSVVSIETVFDRTSRRSDPLQPSGGRGSGIIINNTQGYVLTNAHVVGNAGAIRVHLSDGRVVEGTVVGADTLSDIALLKIPPTQLPAAVLGSAKQVGVGSWVIAIGNPLMFDRSVTVGVISAKGRDLQSPLGDIDLPDLLQTDAAINPGNSGGALVNLDGEVIGIPTVVVRASQAEGLGFAVPVDRAKEVVQAILTHGRVAHPWLGVSYRGLAGGAEPEAGLPPDGRGALVVQVARGGPAAQAGVAPGDVIRRIGSRAVTARDSLGSIIRSLRVGDRLPITVWRAGREQTLQVTIGDMPDSADRRRLFPTEPR